MIITLCTIRSMRRVSFVKLTLVILNFLGRMEW